jgi:hypothetical protein
MSRYRLILLAAAFSLTGGAALAFSTQGVIDALSAQGYTRVEVKVGPTQTKVEAIRGTEKLEVVYDNASGDTLKSETGTVRPGENTNPGVIIRDRNHDFVDGGEGGDGDDSVDDGDDDDHGDDGDDDHGGGDGDGDGDHGGHDGGGDGGGDGGDDH